MSRAYVRDTRNEGRWIRKSRPKPYSPAWREARAKRAAARAKWNDVLAARQARTPEGFIIRAPKQGRAYLHDPGKIDRFLHWQASE